MKKDKEKKKLKTHGVVQTDPATHILPVLMFSCDRITVSRSLDSLLKWVLYHHSSGGYTNIFSIIVLRLFCWKGHVIFLCVYMSYRFLLQNVLQGNGWKYSTPSPLSSPLPPKAPLFIITDIKCNEIVNIIILQYLFSIENQV